MATSFNIGVGGNTYQARPNQGGWFDIYDSAGAALPGWSAGQDASGIGIFQNGNRMASVNPNGWNTGTWTSTQNPALTGNISSIPDAPGVTPPPTVDTNNRTVIPGVQDTAGTLMGNAGALNQGVQNVMGLPGQIDSWLNDIVGRYKVTGRNIIDTMNKAANARAGRGIQGGTENQNLRANLLSQLRGDVQAKQTQALSDAMQLKTGAILAQPGAANTALTTGLNYAGLSAADAQNWANIMASLLRAGYTG